MGTQQTISSYTSLLKKYNVAAPRYTSYPTVPYWQQEAPATQEWMFHVQQAFERSNEISLYIHLPFCENLCTYCGCNTRITKKHTVEQPYIQALLAEWKVYLNSFPEKPVIKELHLGGGTPTFFSPDSLKELIIGIFENADLAEEHEFGFEAHPDSTTEAHLQILFDLGFRRISVGVQDFEDKILEIINRKQTEKQVEWVTNKAREIGYTSVNYDIIFGLPLQKQTHIEYTISKIQQLKPDRIAFYSYAHVPWIKPSQRAYSEKDLPTNSEKRSLYEQGRQALEEAGYTEIGMDHFALKTDALYKSMENGKLHRNFMGYTPMKTELLVGLGASSISDAGTAFVQNIKKVEEYQKTTHTGSFPFYRGHILDEEDRVIRKHISNLMCQGNTNWLKNEDKHKSLFEGVTRLFEMENDGLLKVTKSQIEVTSEGIPFLRNACMALDAQLWRNKPQSNLFSQVV